MWSDEKVRRWLGSRIVVMMRLGCMTATLLRHSARLGMAKIASFAAPTRNSALLQDLMLATGVAPPKKVKQQSMAVESYDTFNERMQDIIINTKTHFHGERRSTQILIPQL